MRRFYVAVAVSMVLGAPVWAQVNGPVPAELPPEGFEGREYVDSRGCAFMRSTFGGEVTWVPRYGPDRQIICDQTPTLQQAASPDPDPAPAPEALAEAEPSPEAEPEAETTETAAAPAPVPRIEPVPQPTRAAPATPQRRARAPQQPRYPQADASGRHPSCPATAPYGQLVDTELGRPLVRCVTSPALLLPEYVNGPAAHAQAQRPAASQPRATGSGRMVQVGSFAVPGNATRLRARLQASGMPVRIYQSRGLSVVSVGPFAGSGQAQSALAQVRRMGFHDAFMR